MTRTQKLALWLASKSGLLPSVSAADIESASAAVKAAERQHEHESCEYRRHVAFKQLTEAGMKKRVASLAIEIAVSKET